MAKTKQAQKKNQEPPQEPPQDPLEKLVWKTVKRKVNDLVPHEKNPRTISDAGMKALQRSLEKFNLAEVPAANLDNTLLAGHRKMKAMQLLGRGGEMVDVRVPNRQLSEAEAKEYMVISNTHAGEWDFQILDMEFKDMDFAEIVFEIAGFDDFLSKKKKASEKQAAEDGFEASDVEAVKTDIVEADIFEIGKHRLLCGNAELKEDVQKLLQGTKPILMVTDVPYGVNYDPMWRHRAGVNNSNRTGQIKNDNKMDWRKAYEIFPGNVAYIWHADKQSRILQEGLETSGFDIVCQVIWAKQQMVFGRGDYHWKHEPCMYAVRKKAKHNWQGDRSQTTLWEIDNLLSKRDADSKTEHSNQKPVECMARPIRNNTSEKDAVYDPFVGSGTTMVACEQMSRTAFCMDLDPRWCQLTIDRMRRLNPKLVIKKNGKPL